MQGPGDDFADSAIQQVDWLPNIVNSEILGQRWVPASNGFVHRIRHISVRYVAGRRGTQLCDIYSLGEIHFE